MNNLAHETSPYLRQHADNPVHWHAWSPEALARAREERKPILLSIGYAACHWCHVMAHESFEDPAIAAVMNDLFINVKVDREERPDLDTIYQHALALLGEQGGWPLTMFCNADGEPFWGGTYFPPTARFGRPGFPDVLRQISRIYAEEPEKVTGNATALRQALDDLSRPKGSAGAVDDERLQAVADALLQHIDLTHGGFAGAPKFPQPAALKLLWNTYRRTASATHRDAVLLTLDRMAQGGIYDHVGGGFARYSVDDRWLAPHFEKMLYDNAQLIPLYTHAWQDTGNPLFAQRVEETITWLLREMINEPGGAFAATLDADSEGEEGKYYVWTAAEIEALLGADAAEFSAAYDVTPGGNWEGKTILNRSSAPIGDDADREARLRTARELLRQTRSQRVSPGRDDKVLADWNGLAIAALAHASQVFRRPDWLAAAQRACAFVCTEMQQDDRLLHSWCAGQAKHRALLDDYANMALGALSLHSATGDTAYLDQAARWVAIADRDYWDSDGSAYFFTAADADDVILRTKSATDNAVPPGNATMVEVLARLHYITGEETYRSRAEAIVSSYADIAAKNPFGFASLLNAAEFLISAVQLVLILPGSENDADTLLAVAHAHSLPNLVLTRWTNGADLPPTHPAHAKTAVDTRPTAYVCRAQTCSLPITDPADLAAALTQ